MMTMEDVKHKLQEHQKGICFLEDKHEYWRGQERYHSVVRKMRMFQEPFDIMKVAKACSNGNNPKYAGRPWTEIIREWDASRIEAGRKGSMIHAAAEKLAIGANHIAVDPEFQGHVDQAKKFLSDHKLNVVQTEQIVWCHKSKIAGTIDLISYNDDGTLSIWDWKTNKESPQNGKSRIKWLEPLTYLPRKKSGGYSVQLSMYKSLLERLGFKVKFAAIVYLTENAYEIIPAQDFMGPANFIIDSEKPIEK